MKTNESNLSVTILSHIGKYTNQGYMPIVIATVHLSLTGTNSSETIKSGRMLRSRKPVK